MARLQDQVESASDVTPPSHNGGASRLASNASSRVSRQRTRDTEPELVLRRELHGRGMRYRVGYYPVPINRRRSINIALVRIRLAAFCRRVLLAPLS